MPLYCITGHAKLMAPNLCGIGEGHTGSKLLSLLGISGNIYSARKGIGIAA